LISDAGKLLQKSLLDYDDYLNILNVKADIRNEFLLAYSIHSKYFYADTKYFILQT